LFGSAVGLILGIAAILLFHRGFKGWGRAAYVATAIAVIAILWRAFRTEQASIPAAKA
jgi:hypothetical protein